MSPALRAAYRDIAAALPAGEPVPVPAGLLLALLGDPAPAAPALLTVQAAAARLGVGPLWVRRHQKQLGVVKVGRSVRISALGLERYLARRGARA